MGTKIILIFCVVIVPINCNYQSEQTKDDLNQQNQTSSTMNEDTWEQDIPTTADHKSNSIVFKAEAVSVNKTDEEPKVKQFLRISEDAEVDVDIYVSYNMPTIPPVDSALRNKIESMTDLKTPHSTKEDSQKLEVKSATMTVYFDEDRAAKNDTKKHKKAKKKNKKNKRSKRRTTTEPRFNVFTRLRVKHATRLDPFILSPKDSLEKKKVETSHTKLTEKQASPDDKIGEKYSYESETEIKKEYELKSGEQNGTAEQIYTYEDAHNDKIKDTDTKILRDQSVTSSKKQTSTKPTEADIEEEYKTKSKSAVLNQKPIYEYIYQDVDTKTDKQIQENKQYKQLTTELSFTDDYMYKDEYVQSETIIVSREETTTGRESKKHKTVEQHTDIYSEEIELKKKFETTRNPRDSEKVKEELRISKPKKNKREREDKGAKTKQQTLKEPKIKTSTMAAPKIGYSEFLSFLSPDQQEKLRIYLENKHKKKLTKAKKKKSTKPRASKKKLKKLKPDNKNRKEKVLRVDIGSNKDGTDSPLEIFYRRTTRLKNNAEGMEAIDDSSSSDTNEEINESLDTY